MSADRAPFSVLIPERGRPDLLGGTLAALADARAGRNVASAPVHFTSSSSIPTLDFSWLSSPVNTPSAISFENIGIGTPSGMGIIFNVDTMSFAVCTDRRPPEMPP